MICLILPQGASQVTRRGLVIPIHEKVWSISTTYPLQNILIYPAICYYSGLNIHFGFGENIKGDLIKRQFTTKNWMNSVIGKLRNGYVEIICCGKIIDGYFFSLDKNPSVTLIFQFTYIPMHRWTNQSWTCFGELCDKNGHFWGLYSIFIFVFWNPLRIFVPLLEIFFFINNYSLV